VTLPVDLEEFVTEHRPHGTPTGDATEPTDNGYLVTVGCPCGVTFLRWVTPEDAAGSERIPSGTELAAGSTFTFTVPVRRGA